MTFMFFASQNEGSSKVSLEIHEPDLKRRLIGFQVEICAVPFEESILYVPFCKVVVSFSHPHQLNNKPTQYILFIFEVPTFTLQFNRLLYLNVNIRLVSACQYWYIDIVSLLPFFVVAKKKEWIIRVATF